MLQIGRVEPNEPSLAELLDEFIAEMSDLYGLDPKEWFGWTDLPAGTDYLLLLDDGTAIGCAALMPFAHSVPEAGQYEAEMKRLYVVPSARGRGHARRLLDALDELARERGYRTLYLETGDRQQAAAGLYLTSGWQPVERYGPWVDNPESLCFQREVPGTDDA